MVIEDITTVKRVKKPASTQCLKAANPFDRIASFVIDYFIIFLPIFSLIVAPFQHSDTYLMFFGTYESYVSEVVAIGMFALISFIIFQTVSLSFFSATPGMKVFKLYVVSSNQHKKIGFFRSLLRTVSFLLMAVFAFFPLLFLLRVNCFRGVHDFMSGTMVVTKSEHYKLPHPYELKFVRAMYVGFISLFVVFAIIPFLFSPSLKSSDETLTVFNIKNEKECSRLIEGKTAKELLLSYFSQEFPDPCYLSSSNKNLIDKKSRPYGFLLKLLTLPRAKDSTLQSKYVERICADNTILCTMAKAESSQFVFPLNKKVIKEGLDSDKKLFAYWAMQYAKRTNRYEAIDYIFSRSKGLIQPNAVSEASYIQSLWAKNNFKKATEELDKYTKTYKAPHTNNLLSWSCFQGVKRSCQYAKSNACSQFSKEYSNSEWRTAQHQLTMLRLAECKGDGKLDYLALHSDTENKKIKAEIYALNLIHRGKIKKGIDVLNEVLLSSETPNVVKEDVALRLVGLKNENTPYGQIYEWWKKAPRSLNWTSIGQSLLTHRVKIGSYENAIKISEHMASYRALDLESRKSQVVAHYHVGERKRAWQLYKAISPQRRQLASSNKPYEQVLTMLKKEFER